jgi:hypothetical protein
MIEPLEPWPKPTQSKESKALENRALLKCYENGKDIIEFGNIITNLPQSLFKSRFKGGFKEVDGMIHGHFVLKGSTFKSSFYEFDHFEIHIHPSGLFEYSHYNSLKEIGEFWPFRHAKKSYDHASTLLAFMNWARAVNPDFDKQFDIFIQEQKKGRTKVAAALQSKNFDKIDSLKNLVNEFEKAGRLSSIKIKRTKDLFSISAYTEKNKPFTREDTSKFIELGAMVICSGPAVK